MFLYYAFVFDQIGVGLMVFQQFGGINGICFYVSNIFESAGNETFELHPDAPRKMSRKSLVHALHKMMMTKKVKPRILTSETYNPRWLDLVGKNSFLR